MSGDWQGYRERYVENRAMRRSVEVLKRKGWRWLASEGCCFTQAIMVSPCGQYVAKMVKLGNRDGWPKFIKWAHSEGAKLEHGARHLPRVYTVREFGGACIAIMERLHPLTHHDGGWCVEPLSGCPAPMRRIVTLAGLISQFSDKRVFTLSPRIVGGLREAVHAMSAALGHPKDLHGSNMMVRRGPRGGVETLVLIDPYGYV